MAKSKQIFECSNCGGQFPKWSGQCPDCNKWGTLEEGAVGGITETPQQQRKEARKNVKKGKTQSFADIVVKDAQRIASSISEFDRVLGGGIVPGSLVLLGGHPGIGKSTLVAQVAGSLGAAAGQVLYVSGEESAQQIKLRFDRLKIKQDQLEYMGDATVEVVCKTIEESKPAVVIVDSIQTMASGMVDSEPGSVSQVKACTVQLLEVAKSTGVPVLIIGHVTKGGELGGPKTLEHIVDTVLYLEGDRNHQFRILRSVKNRFGSTKEIGVFEMKREGLAEVKNPSEVFIGDRSDASGTCMTAVIEGNRVFLLEVQALVNKTTFGYPQRKCSGFDLNRLNLLLAVLTRRAQLPFDSHDVYINVVGGVSFSEPAMDMAVCMALVSALEDKPLSTETVAWGEVGLGGEVRSVPRHEERTKESLRFGLKQGITPKTVKTIKDAIEKL